MHRTGRKLHAYVREALGHEEIDLWYLGEIAHRCAVPPRPIPQAAAKQRTHTRFIQLNPRVDTFESGNRPFPVDDRT